MWEAATPPPQPDEAQSRTPPARPEPRGSDDLVLWAQLILCGLILAGVLAARALQLPLFAELRVAYTAALAANEGGLLDDERDFAHFVQQTLGTLGQAAQEVLAQLRGTPVEEGLPPTAPTTVPEQPPAPTPAPETAAGNGAEGPVQSPSPTPTAGMYAASRTAKAHRAKNKAAPAGSSLKSYQPAFPLADPLGGGYRTSSPYGWRTDPVTGKGQDFHKGADLAVAEGTTVSAAAAGVVRRAGYNRSYGNYVRILHENGDETLYAHLQYLFVRAGQPVEIGQRLGTVGQTGNATGPHLHFELLHEGVRYDPARALQNAA